MDAVKQQQSQKSRGPGIDPKSREATQDREAKEALQRSFEHGAPETGDEDDFAKD